MILVAGVTFFAVRLLFLSGPPDLAGYARVRLGPLIDRSNQLGAEFQQFLVRPPGDRAQAKSQLELWDGKAADLVEDAAALRPPRELAPATAYLLTAFRARATGLAGYRETILAALDTTKTNGLVERLLEIDTTIVAGDRAYELFQAEIRDRAGENDQNIDVAQSAYFPDESQATAPSVKPFVERILGAPQAGSGRDVAVAELTVSPEPQPNEKGKLVVDEPGPLKIVVHVENHGERAEPKLAVKAELRDSSRSELVTTMREVALDPGAAQDVEIDDLVPFPNQENGLIISVGPLPGETVTADNTKSIEFIWRG